MTWPLAGHLSRDLPWDLGDSLLNCWILGWDADHLLRLLKGDFAALHGFWNANIFYPEPLALAYSEHLVAQAIQILPVYGVTGNLVLCYNLLFLSTFVLSGLGVFLLVRELTASPRAAFVSGLLYGFALYRIGQFSHMQVLSSQWMPFALFGFRRYFETRRVRALVGAAAALVAQNLSCGYFLVYFAPFVAAYLLYEMADRRLLRDRRTWLALIAANAAALIVTWPFLSPYLELRQRGLPPRSIDEVRTFSADVYSYLSAHPSNRVWGSIIQAFPKPEGELFPGVVPLVLAGVAVLFYVQAVRTSTANAPKPDRTKQRIATAAIVIAGAYLLVAALILATGGFTPRVGPVLVRMTGITNILTTVAICGAALLIVSPRARAIVRGIPRSAVAFYGVAAIMAAWLSFGPTLTSRGRPIGGTGPYGVLYRHVPGFDGLRVPARYGMLTMLFLSIVAGYGAAGIERRYRGGHTMVLLAGLLFIVEAGVAPIELDGNWEEHDLVTPPREVLTGDRMPAVYRFAATLPAEAVLIEFPFGADQYELRYMYFSTIHWRPLVNGYSGGFPRSYMARKSALQYPMANPSRAWEMLASSPATHAIVHEGAFLNQDGADVSRWLAAHGAQEVSRFGSDRVFGLP